MQKSMDGELLNQADTLTSGENFCVHFTLVKDATSIFTLHRKTQKLIQSGFAGQLTAVNTVESR
ncbi:MAG: hypothetical protein SCALA701_21180 [Candidatus Scalindua sp.]|nr:MAG: hypothetical protein SCALA701_21180 [Candidatus Scalindua sp.]